MSLADNLGARQPLEAAHRAGPPLEVLMVALDALLHQLAGDVRHLGQDCGEGWWVDRRSISFAKAGVTSVLSTARVKNVVAAAVSRVGLT